MSEHDHKHHVFEGKKPGTWRCHDCGWRWPCIGNDCGHSDCIEFRQELPVCHGCGKRVQGPPAGWRCPGSQLPELVAGGAATASWTSWNVRGLNRAMHFCCRDAVAAPHDLLLWYGQGQAPSPCTHGLDNGVDGPHTQAQGDDP